MNSRSLLFLLIGICALAALFVLYKPADAPLPDVGIEAEPVLQSPSVPPPPSAITFAWRTEKGAVISAPDSTQVRQGEKLIVQVITDRKDELHVHGYDLQLMLQPGVPAQLEFVAEHSGRFELELHGAHLELGVIEVLP